MNKTSPAPRVFRSLGVVAALTASFAVAAPAALARPKTERCANLSHARSIRATGLSCRSADTVVRAALAGRQRKPDGYSCASKVSGTRATVTCHKGKRRIVYTTTIATGTGTGTPPTAPPLAIDSATVSGSGTDVRVTVASPQGSDGLPTTTDGLLVYASNSGCPSTFQSADAQARSGQPDGFVANAYVGADVANTPFGDSATYSNGAFTFDVASGNVFTANGVSPFSTACAMLYSGQPGTLTPAANTALATTQAPLVIGAGAPNNQP